MKAIQISEFGDADVLKYVDIAEPVCGPNEVLVKVNAAGVNPIDYKTRKGLGFVANYLKDKLPWIPGFDFAGEVVACGENFNSFLTAQNVVGFANFPQGGGAYAEYVSVPVEHIIRKPARVSMTAAGALPIAGLTAYQALIDSGNVQANEKILILAGAGGVGHLAIQIAKLKQAHVFATSSKAKLDFIAALGADIVLDYANPAAIAAAGPYDLIIDNRGGQTGLDALGLLNPKGRLITIPTVSAAGIISKATSLNRKAQGLTVRFEAAQLTQLLHWMEEEKLKLHIDKTYLLSEASLAHQDIEQDRTTGKRVLIIP